MVSECREECLMDGCQDHQNDDREYSGSCNLVAGRHGLVLRKGGDHY